MWLWNEDWHRACYVECMDIQRIDLKQKARRRRIVYVAGGIIALIALVGFAIWIAAHGTRSTKEHV